jgi:arsenate reductase (thioredoxin)
MSRERVGARAAFASDERLDSPLLNAKPVPPNPKRPQTPLPLQPAPGTLNPEPFLPLLSYSRPKTPHPLKHVTQKLRVLFICMGNANRSQMAEGFARALKGDSIEAFSAGLLPGELGPLTVETMSEAGVDLSSHRSKHVEEFINASIDYAVVLCPVVQKQTPWLSHKFKVLHIPFDDPPTIAHSLETEDQKREVYRRVRDQIKSFILTLPGGLINLENQMKIEASERAMANLASPKRKKWFFF